MSDEFFNMRLTEDEAERLERFVAEDEQFNTQTAFVKWCVFTMGMDRWRVHD